MSEKKTVDNQDTEVPGSQPLENAKRELFCQELVKDWNRTQAAIRAGYSERTAYSLGNRLLKFVEVSERIEYLVSQILSRHAIEQDDIIEELRAIGFSNILDYIEPEERDVKIKDFKHMHTKIKRKRFKPVQSIKETKYGVEFRLYDKISALDKLGQYFNMWKGEGGDGEDEKPKPPDEMRKELGIEE